MLWSASRIVSFVIQLFRVILLIVTPRSAASDGRYTDAKLYVLSGVTMHAVVIVPFSPPRKDTFSRLTPSSAGLTTMAVPLEAVKASCGRLYDCAGSTTW